ncbi:ISL1 protein, partial [Nothoprocta ornata]|nr:ISL1 protein [Nothoprocta ornata]
MGDMGDPPKKKRLISLCVGCGNQIHDQYILRVSPDLEWHAACLKCAECNQYLDETCTCFVRDGKTYCKRDYIRYAIYRHKTRVGSAQKEQLLAGLARCCEGRAMSGTGGSASFAFPPVPGRFGQLWDKLGQERPGGRERAGMSPRLVQPGLREKREKSTSLLLPLSYLSGRSLPFPSQLTGVPGSPLRFAAGGIWALAATASVLFLPPPGFCILKVCLTSELRVARLSGATGCPGAGNIQGMTGTPMVAASPERHDGGLQANPVEVQSYQPPWKVLSDFALQSDIDQPAFQQLVNFSEGGPGSNSTGSEVASMSSQLPDTPNSMVASPIEA